VKYREDECAPPTWDWRDDARVAAQDLAREHGTLRQLTDAEVRELTPGYPWPRFGTGKQQIIEAVRGE
jgi:hypothetical protein